MTHTPTPPQKRISLLSWGFIFAGGILFVLQGGFPKAKAALQGLGIVLMSIGIYIAVRYLLTSFCYRIDPRHGTDADGEGDAVPAADIDIRCLPADMLDFTIAKTVGRRLPVLDARFGLDELVYFAELPREGGRDREPYKTYPSMRVYNYTASPRPEKQYIAVFLDDANNATGLLLEPSAEMAAFMENIVSGKSE